MFVVGFYINYSFSNDIFETLVRPYRLESMKKSILVKAFYVEFGTNIESEYILIELLK